MQQVVFFGRDLRDSRIEAYVAAFFAKALSVKGEGAAGKPAMVSNENGIQYGVNH